jgi:hypothetical protein
LRAERRREKGLAGNSTAPGLGKLLVVAPDQVSARRYHDVLRGWVPAAQAETGIRLAVSDERDAHETLAAFRLRPDPSILITVAMAYEGLDAPEVAVVAALTHIRSRAWLEQMVARATRVDPQAGPYERQRALVYHPDDPLFALFRHRVETEQGTLARRPKPRRQTPLPLWLREQLAEQAWEAGIVPLASNALGLRYDTLKPGPDFVLRRPDHEGAQADLLEPPSVVERQLRQRIGALVAAQAVEDEGALQAPRGQGLYHRYNAILKRVLGNKGRAAMSLAELAAAIGWLERNRLAEHAHLLEGDARYAWTARQRRGEWTPPVGRVSRAGQGPGRKPAQAMDGA